uniref:Abhydrolase domain containing 14B n=1 Tax=Anser brachyrhynchus TaxID=132585 RepID=A0A8B9C8G0_9AVES
MTGLAQGTRQMCRPPSRRRSRPPWGHPKRQRPRPVPSPSRPVPIAPSHGAQSHGAGEGDTGGDLPRSAGSPLGMPRGCETSLKIRQSDVEPLDASGRCCCRAGAVRRSPPQLPAVSQGRARCHPAWYGDERPSCVTKQGATTPPSSAPWGHRSLQLAEEAQQRPVEVPRLVQVAGMASARQHDHTVPGEVPEAVQGLVAQAGVPVTVQDQGGRLKKRGERRDVREGDANPYPSPQEAAGLRKAEGGQSPAPPEPWPSTCPVRRGRRRAPAGGGRSCRCPVAGPEPPLPPVVPWATCGTGPWVTSPFLSRTAGLGRSKDAVAPAPVGQPAPGDFLKAVVEALSLGPAVVVSPSLSGMYSLPFLFQHGHLVKAYVPVAPICTDKFPVEQYAQIKTPTLIVYGDQDVELGQASLNNLRHLPEHQVLVLQGAGHACYLDKPEEWHRGLLAFLQQLE